MCVEVVYGVVFWLGRCVAVPSFLACRWKVVIGGKNLPSPGSIVRGTGNVTTKL